MESDEDLARRLYYITGDLRVMALHGKMLDARADEYGLKRRKKSDVNIDALWGGIGPLWGGEFK